MARSPKLARSQDLISRISDTIADHPRLSAAAAFQIGVLLGQVMQNSGAIRGIGRKMAAAPAAIASGIPTFGLFEGSTREPQRRTASHRDVTKRAKTGGTKRRNRARTG